MRKELKVNHSRARAVCPLCEKTFLKTELHAYPGTEPRASRLRIIEAIQETLPSWVETDGACKRCWESFRGVTCVRDYMKGLKFPVGNTRRKGGEKGPKGKA
jgi:hypothetical protein